MDQAVGKQEITKNPEQKWDANFFKQYLIALGRGKNFLISVKDFPDRIELYPQLTSVLYEIGRHTKIDLHERWALLGLKSDKTKLLTQAVPIKAERDHVPGQLIKTEIERAINKVGIETIIGDIHSHPSGFSSNKGEGGAFSAVDMYDLVVKGKFLPVVGVVDGNQNIFAFRSRESQAFDIDRNIFNAESFERYWYELNGFKYLGLALHGNRTVPIAPNASHQRVNIGIATRHNLALYKGFAAGDLVRIWPK